MRPALRIFMLPLVLLALMLQFGAAVSEARAQANSLNPFAAIPICSPDKDGARSGAEGSGAPADHHGDHHCGACLISAVAHVAPLLASTEVEYPAAVAAAAPATPILHALPRGPPLRAPNARGPPTLA